MQDTVNKMEYYRTEFTVQRNRDAVFVFLADLRNHIGLADEKGVASLEVTGSPLHAGCEFHLLTHSKKYHYVTTIHVDEISFPERIVHRYQYSYTDHDGNKLSGSPMSWAEAVTCINFYPLQGATQVETTMELYDIKGILGGIKTRLMRPLCKLAQLNMNERIVQLAESKIEPG